MFTTLGNSKELQRIRAAERCSTDASFCPELMLGKYTANPAQRRAMEVWRRRAQLVGSIELGGGKTLIAAGLKPDLVMGPGGHRYKIIKDFVDAGFPEPKFLSYEEMTLKNRSDKLDRLRPKLIVCDEAHYLTETHTCTKRLQKYLQKNPATGFVPLSASLVPTRDPLKYAHLFDMALMGNSPFPHGRSERRVWKQCLDLNEPMTSPGVLGADKLQAIDWLKHRIATWPGVVYIPDDQQIGVALNIREHYGIISENYGYLQGLEETWAMPDGRELLSASEVWDAGRQLALGGYYKWTARPPHHWSEARRNFARFVREKIRYTEDIETEAQVFEKFIDAYEVRAWLAVREEFKPEKKWVQLNNSLAANLTEHILIKDTPSLVWCYYPGAAWSLSQQLGVPYFHEPNREFEKYSGTCVISQDAFTAGLNLQRYAHNVFLTPDADPDAWHQRLGRTHRFGQERDVSCDVLLLNENYAASFQEARKTAAGDRANKLSKATYLHTPYSATAVPARF